MTLKHFKNNAILKPITDGGKVDGILIPQQSRIKVYEGIVQSCSINEQIKEGDHVLYEAYAGFEMKYGEEIFVICQLEDVIAKYTCEHNCGDLNKLKDFKYW